MYNGKRIGKRKGKRRRRKYTGEKEEVAHTGEKEEGKEDVQRKEEEVTHGPDKREAHRQEEGGGTGGRTMERGRGNARARQEGST